MVLKTKVYFNDRTEYWDVPLEGYDTFRALREEAHRRQQLNITGFEFLSLKGEHNDNNTKDLSTTGQKVGGRGRSNKFKSQHKR